MEETGKYVVPDLEVGMIMKYKTILASVSGSAIT